MYKIGAAKSDITVVKEGVGMLGWCAPGNVVKDAATALNARAVVIDDGKCRIAIVNLEIAFITISLKLGIVKALKEKYPELGLGDANVMVTAQHTHSAPGGFSHYPQYNITIPGYVPEVFQKFVDGSVGAIVSACKVLKPGTIKFGSGEFDAKKEIAFNRSYRAYNQNPDVDKVSQDETQFATNREMDVLRFDDESGKPIAIINWFGTHCTSFSSDKTSIHFDNKGYASQYFEESTGNNCIAIFAQASAGDVTPNFVYDKKKKWTRGKYENDDESAQYAGRLQHDMATSVFNRLPITNPLDVSIDYRQNYVDFGKVEVSPEFTNGIQGITTGPSCLGVAFFKGTAEGPGLPKPIYTALEKFTQLVKSYELIKAPFLSQRYRDSILHKYDTQGPKKILIEGGHQRVLGTRDVEGLVVPSFVDSGVRISKMHAKASKGIDKPWMPQILPVQTFILGNIAIVGVPGEVTTVSGRRLEQTVLEQLKQRGVDKVIIASYANEYCGYITTQEEYLTQHYEGGHTVFGQWTLAAIQTENKRLAELMVKEPENTKWQPQQQPLEFTEFELSKRLYTKDIQYT